MVKMYLVLRTSGLLNFTIALFMDAELTVKLKGSVVSFGVLKWVAIIKKSFDSKKNNIIEFIYILSSTSQTYKLILQCKIYSFWLSRQLIPTGRLIEKLFVFTPRVSKMQSDELDSKLDLFTLFVRRIPTGTTNQELEEYFSNYGPLRSCFVVDKKQASSQDNASIGFVNFASKDDALQAKQKSSSLKFKNQKLKVEFAVKKHLTKQLPSDSKNDLISQVKSRNSQQDKPSPSSHLLLYQLPCDTSKADLLKFLSVYVKNKSNIVHPYLNDSSKACVQFSSKEKALEAQTKINNSKFKESKIVAFISTDLKGHRLIVRNLSFNCTERSLFEKFKEFGELLECLIPMNDRQRPRGFAILQFATKEAATKCLTEMNGKKVNKREIAVDWCLPKHAYQTTIQASNLEKEEEEEEIASDDELLVEENEHQEMEEPGDEMSEDDEKDDFFNLNDDCELEEQQLEEYSAESEDDCFEPSLDDDEESQVPTESKKQRDVEMTDKPKFTFSPFTVFVRNVAFDANEDDLRNIFGQFGKVVYAKLVLDKGTGTPKGTAFVNFSQESSYESCLAKGAESNGYDVDSLVHDESRGIQLHGRTLHVLPALDKETARQLPEQKIAHKEQHDKRNLYLLSEGYISAESMLAKKFSLTEHELKLRSQSFQERKSKLKNLNYFISKTRLSLRNLPLTLDEKQLKQIFVDAGCKAFLLKQVKIVRSKDRKDQQGNMRSMGYGFVEIKTHEKALEMLRHLNDNLTSVFEKGRKPIIEFSIENKAILDKRQSRNGQLQQKETKPMAKKSLAPSKPQKATGLKRKFNHSNSSNKKRKFKK